MRNTALSIAAVHLDAPTEQSLIKKDGTLKALAEKNAQNFAYRNLPAKRGDKLSHYIGELASGYEKLAADMYHTLQPAANFPEAKIEADYYREKDGKLESTLKELEHKNNVALYNLPNADTKTVNLRIMWAFIATLIISIGETVFNTKSFQVTGESMLFALILAISVSFAVFIFSHMIPLLYKEMKTKRQRIALLCGAFILVTGLFTALAIFRSTYLATHDVHIKPIYFVLINLFFFIVSTVLSFFVLPTWEELKENAQRLQQLLIIKRRKAKIERLKKEREAIRNTILAKTKDRVRILHLTNYTIERIRKMYFESVELFKRTNLTYRPDGKVPDCFNDSVQSLEINDAALNSSLPTKQS